MRKIAIRLKEARTSLGLSANDFGKRVGKDGSTVLRYENNQIKNVTSDYIEKVSEVAGVSPSWLMGWTNKKNWIPHEETEYLYSVRENSVNYKTLTEYSKMIPVIGSISAGTPILAVENRIGYEITTNKKNDFCLKVHDDSMINARICEGDIVFVHKQNDVESGEIAICIVNDNDATIKKVIKQGNNVILQPLNPKYEPTVFNKTEMKNVKILGKVISCKFDV